MKILFLTYFFEPDLCAGSFRNSSLLKELHARVGDGDTIDVYTTQPNRYDSYKVEAESFEKRGDNLTITRINIPKHKSGMLSQIKSFIVYYFEISKKTRNKKYDLVYVSSGRFFSTFLAAKIARRNSAKLYLDIRDIFIETIMDVFKSVFMKFILKLILTPIENYIFKRADHINLVSKGFKSYFDKYSDCTYSYFTNGIDDVFLNVNKGVNITLENNITRKKKTILYAGNIGESQGLHIILPSIAKAFKNEFEFLVFGDGGAKQKLVNSISEGSVSNIKIMNPINRETLIEEYKKADFLFLHLNKQLAFERVLPSKLFEYGAFNKPVIAGVSGYSAEFLKKEMINCILFNPGDSEKLIKELKKYEYKEIERKEFKYKFSRKRINIEMVKSIMNL